MVHVTTYHAPLLFVLMNLYIARQTKEAKDYSKDEIFLIIQTFITEQVELAQRKTLDEDSFNKPSWSEYQAFHLGMQKAYLKIATFFPDPEGK